MRAALKRSVLVLLVLAMLLGVVLALPVSAASDGQRFIFHSLTSAKGRVYIANGDFIALTLAEQESSFSANGLQTIAGDTNALYISLQNRSNATALRVTYRYKIYAVSESETVEQSLLPNQEAEQSFVLRAPNISKDADAIEISFVCNGTPTGTVTIYSCLNVSSYTGGTGRDVTLTRCHYDSETKSVAFEGSLSYAATVLYGGETLALFALEAGEDLHLSSKTPIARTGVSFSFSFRVNAQERDALFQRYVVAVVTQKGERIPLCTPTYPSFTQVKSESENGFKGFHTEMLSDVLDSAVGVEIVDVYLDRLYGQQNSGILYAGEHSYYYFDEEYVGELDRRIRNLTGIGAQIYLRFLITPQANGLSFTDYSGAEQNIENKLPAIRSEQAGQDVYALTGFLTERYADKSIGRVHGIILGRAADLAATHSYTSEIALESYTALYMTALNLIAGAGRLHIPELRIVVPLSDTVWSQSMQDGDKQGYYSALFLPSLLCAMSEHTLDPQRFSVMVESHTVPERVGGDVTRHFGVDRLGRLLATLQSLTSDAPFLDTRILYSWTPDPSMDATALKAAYLLQYAVLCRNARVDAFIVDFSLQEAKGESSGAEDLAYLARYIDTDRFSEAAATALSYLGIASLSELYSDWNDTSLQRRRIHHVALSTDGYATGAQPSGSYALWNFISATGVLNWYAGQGCTNLSVLSAEKQEQSALTAAMDGTLPYSDIAYHFAAPTDISFAPLLQFELSVQSRKVSRYEVQLKLLGDTDQTVATAIVTAGDKQTLYLDLSQYAAVLSNVRSIRLVARPLDGDCETFDLRLYTFTLQSPTLSNSELADRISAIQQTDDQNSEENTPHRDFTLPLVVSAVVVLVSAAIIAFLVISRKSRRLTVNKKG